ncbi:hypothetical protein [Brevundimonas sp.]|uniref:hypothetical protein n=1 Tax=Brevundimonas sp. TaxID=1871086 RepID=UPI001A1DA986|nr:hypothetical protein [Brevundimonas sp.]MBJ7483503.1 hypothetical protein [Brevundimonas sp.]
MSLNELLEAKQLRRALIVDDACDPVPTASDIGAGAGEWAVFGDDWGPHRKVIADAFGSLDGVRLDELKSRDGFVAALWGLREELPKLLEPLFAAYVSAQAADTHYVELAKAQLEALGLEVVLAGREFSDPLQGADIVLIDLFLGNAQDDAAITTSKSALKAALDARGLPHPLVILMSRSAALEDRRDEFRDEVGLLDSGFRIIRKDDLEAGERLEQQLQRLAAHVEDTRKLGAFVAALDAGLTQAAGRTLAQFRRLKLSDVGQIQQLLLEVEGEPIGSYLVDVFDRVLAHEIEGEAGIIDAARALNSFSAADYPAPYIAGSPELQGLVAKTLTQHTERLRLPSSEQGLVSFGDVIRLEDAAGVEAAKRDLLVDLEPDSVLLVLTPACDLQRDAAPRVLMLVGKIRQFGVKDWTYRNDARTSVITIEGERRWISWNDKHVETVSWAQLETASQNGVLRTVSRLREGHAIEIQQKVLAGLGRVGLVAAMPATFEVDVAAYYLGADKRPIEIQVGGLADGAVCFVGRDAQQNQLLRLAMTEPAVDDLQAALRNVGEQAVAQECRGAYRHVVGTTDLTTVLTRGLPLKNVAEKWSRIDAVTGPEAAKVIIGLIAWNKPEPSLALERGDWGKAGFLLHLTDRPEGESAGRTDAVRHGLVAPPDGDGVA